MFGMFHNFVGEQWLCVGFHNKCAIATLRGNLEIEGYYAC